MGTVLNVFIGIVILIVAVWISIFGGVGALLSRVRGASVATGFTFGTLLGPLGWIAIMWVTRASAKHIEPATNLGNEPELVTADPWDD